MPPRRSKTKRHPNGALETTFQIQIQGNFFPCLSLPETYALRSTAQPPIAPAPAPAGPGRATRRQAVVEDVDNNDHLPHAALAAPPTTQPAIVPAPVQPSCNTNYQATVEDANDDGDQSISYATVPPPANPSIHVTFDETPQRRRHQEELVEEGGSTEGKSC